ncbi:hypothetical protein AAFF_G00414270 [Aldrovandia affinis]|uniref:Ig-like domain-containing protein n=1 Tax=Aldrovandia affinis TaxID=143900 RepID=A0AAD7SB05_9TELE|nr:hypothetical protein AAFF_G00414270 [Aldrovandia affinis]
MAVHKLTAVLLLFTGVSGELQFYSRVGDTVTLPCKHKNDNDCSSASWIHNRPGSGKTDEIVTGGKVRDQNQERSGKLTVGSDCSLHINNLTTADTGPYTCRLYHDAKNFTDARLSLTLLSITSSSPLTELKNGSTLLCEVYLRGMCTRSMCVTWVSETETAAQGDRCTVEGSRCSSTLTLQHSDYNRKWTCQLTVRGELKASYSYTQFHPVTPSHTHHNPGQGLTKGMIGSIVTVCLAVIIVVILIIIYRRRTENNTVINQDKGQMEGTITYAEINLPAAQKREPDRHTANSHTEYATIKICH